MKSFFKLKLLFCAVYICSTVLIFAKDLIFPERLGHIPKSVLNSIKERGDEFLADLSDVLNEDINNIFILVDKEHSLPKSYVPYQLQELNTTPYYYVNKAGLRLTPQAEDALARMGRMAKKDGVSLLVSSAYRSYEYQAILFDRYSKQYGVKEAQRFSARAGTTQHQLGTVIDFGSISEEYAETKAGKWLHKNAGKYGWSLSFPKNYEHVTGYVWECWHYRYLGVKACNFQKKYFGDIQQYMLEFIDWWKTSGLEF